MPIEQLYSRISSVSPPPDLIRYVCGHSDYAEFLRSGAEVFTMLDRACWKEFGKSIEAFEDILDFGCGIGRVAQFFERSSAPAAGLFAKLFGRGRKPIRACDVSARVIEHVRKALPQVDSYVSGLYPPLIYASESFDLVYSFSVFSHLDQKTEDVWLGELARIGKKGCVYLLTVHGDWCIRQLLGDAAPEAKEKGFYYAKVHQRDGSDLDFPDYYEASFHTARYIEAHWTREFELVGIFKGNAPKDYLAPGEAFEPEGEIPRLGHMGQDLIVLRRRS